MTSTSGISYRWGWMIVVGVGMTLLAMLNWMSTTIQAAPLTTIVVNSTADVIADDGQCTLREAITAANTDTASGTLTGECSAGNFADMITFEETLPPTITLTLTGTGEDENAKGDLDIWNNVTIRGNAMTNTVIHANQIDRVIDILTGTVMLENLTLYRGKAPTDANKMGGGARNAGTLRLSSVAILESLAGEGDYPNRSGGDGGGLWNSGTLIITNTLIISNSAGDALDRYGTAGRGGGIYTIGEILVEHSTIAHNKAGGGGRSFQGGSPGGDGGGIYSLSVLTLSNSAILQNSAGDGGWASDTSYDNGEPGGVGGGLYSSGVVAIFGSTIAQNSAGDGSGGSSPLFGSGAGGGAGGGGGGMFISGDTLIVSSAIMSNTSGAGGDGGTGYTKCPPFCYGGGGGGNGGSGGGIMITSGEVSVKDSLIESNRTGAGGGGGYGIPVGGNGLDGSGGGIAVTSGSTLTIENSTIYDNATARRGTGVPNLPIGTRGKGGGVYNEATTTINNSTISGNFAYGRGGGIYSVSPAFAMQNSTIVLNQSVSGAGGIGTETVETYTVIGNSIFAYNQSPGPRDCQGGFISLGYILIAHPKGCEMEGDMTGNIYGQLPHLLPLADNGGSTPTHAFAEGSPAIDTGNCPTVTSDQRGEPRPVDLPAFPNGSGNQCDIGAFESQPIKTYPTRTITPTRTPTATFTPANTPTITNTPTETLTPTPSTPTITPLPTYTLYPTYTPYPTYTTIPGNQSLYLPLVQRNSTP